MARERRYSAVLAEADAQALSAAFPQHELRAAPDYAAGRARLLLGCYPRGQAHDPETYVAALAAVLSEFSEAVIATVTDPRSGIARTVKFLPAVAEVVTACEGEAERRRTVGHLARQHLRVRNEIGYRERLQRVLDYAVGAPPVAKSAGDPVVAKAAAETIQAAVKRIP